jgi:hypothetical protein
VENVTGISQKDLAIRGGSESASSYSSVSKFGTRYRPLHPDMSANEQVEALIESSPLSFLRNNPQTTDYATYSKSKSNAGLRSSISSTFSSRPARKERFLGDDEERGGTVVVHYIKKQEWFVETMVALLGGADEQGTERQRGQVGVGLGMLEWKEGRLAGETHGLGKETEEGGDL